MFKLGAFTDEISQDLERACQICIEFGLEGAEIRGVWDTPCQKLSDAQVQDIKTILTDHGMVTCCIASPFGKCTLENPAEIAEHMDVLRRCADIGLELDCRLVRGFAFWDRDQVSEKPWDAMLAAFEQVHDILEERDVVLGLENEASTYVGTAGQTRYFIDRLGCDRVKPLWDPANHVQDPQGRDVPSYPDGYDAIKGDMVHVHVKDAAPDNDSMPNVFLGMGICRWTAQLEAFARDGYDGFISLETHVNPDRFPESFQEKYGHLLTGKGREGASRVCLAWLRDAVQSLKDAR